MRAELNGIEVDMDPDEVPGFTYAIYEPFEVGVVTGHRSTTIDIPATNAARAAAGGVAITEEQGESTLRIGQGTDYWWQGRVLIEEQTRDTITLQSVGGNASWTDHLNNRNLRDLDLGVVPELTAVLQVASNQTTETPYCFPLIDYFGWDAADPVTTEVVDLLPGIRIGYAVEAALDEIGWTIVPRGSLTTGWYRYIIPSTGGLEGLVPSAEVIAENVAKVDSSASSVFTPEMGLYTGSISWPFSPDTTVDPGGNIVSAVHYNAPFPCTISTTVRFFIEPFDTDYSENRFLQFWLETSGGTIISPAVTRTLWSLGTGDQTIELPDVTVAAGTTVVVKFTYWYMTVSPPLPITVTMPGVTFTVKNVTYGPGTSFDLASAAPDMTVMDAFKGMILARDLVFTTDELARRITVFLAREFFKGPNGGVSWLGREDHSELPVKKLTEKPTRLVLRYAQDTDDAEVRRLNVSVGDRLYGGYIEDMGGSDREKVVESPFAATAMGTYTNGTDVVFIPKMRYEDENGDAQVRYRWKPRILYLDEFALTGPGWTHDGDPKDNYPKSFFVSPSDPDLSLSFGTETVYGPSPGAVQTCYQRTMERIRSGRSLVIHLRIGDEEVSNIDFGQPIEVHDGEMSHWYHIAKIEQKRFGVDEYTECELIPL